MVHIQFYFIVRVFFLFALNFSRSSFFATSTFSHAALCTDVIKLNLCFSFNFQSDTKLFLFLCFALIWLNALKWAKKHKWNVRWMAMAMLLIKCTVSDPFHIPNFAHNFFCFLQSHCSLHFRVGLHRAKSIVGRADFFFGINECFFCSYFFCSSCNFGEKNKREYQRVKHT